MDKVHTICLQIKVPASIYCAMQEKMEDFFMTTIGTEDFNSSSVSDSLWLSNLIMEDSSGYGDYEEMQDEFGNYLQECEEKRFKL